MPYKKDPEKVRVYNRAYRAANLEKVRAAVRTWAEANRERQRQYRRKRLLFRLYGFSPEEYEVLKMTQGGVCALCSKPPGRKRLSVDHDHITGKIRGLLCDNCNRGIGLLGDTVAAVEAALKYLSKGQNGG